VPYFGAGQTTADALRGADVGPGRQVTAETLRRRLAEARRCRDM
jgi:hypothetical protein